MAEQGKVWSQETAISFVVHGGGGHVPALPEKPGGSEKDRVWCFQILNGDSSAVMRSSKINKTSQDWGGGVDVKN